MHNPKVFWISIVSAALFIGIVILAISSISILGELEQTLVITDPTLIKTTRAKQLIKQAALLSGVGILVSLVCVLISFS